MIGHTHWFRILREKLAGIGIGALLIAYGGSTVALRSAAPDTPAKQALCKLGMCPTEFSPPRLFELRRKSFGSQGGRAVRELKRALSEEPAAATRWAELAEVLPDSTLAEYCVRTAGRSAPRSSSMLIRIGNLFFSMGKHQEAIAYFRQVVDDPEFSDLYPTVYMTYARMDVTLEQLLRSGIPERGVPARAFLRFQIEARRLEAADTVWRWMQDHQLVDSRLAADYIHFLIEEGNAKQAADVWAHLNGRLEKSYRVKNWIFNGDFERPPSISAFDWKIEPDDSIQAEILGAVNGRDKRCLELRFPGSANTDFRGVHEDAVLSPGRWRLVARVSTERLTTDQGIGVRVFDARMTSRLDIRTATLTGTNGWTTLDETFQVRSETDLVRIEIFRRPSSKFDNKISGTAWIDDLSLVPVL